MNPHPQHRAVSLCYEQEFPVSQPCAWAVTFWALFGVWVVHWPEVVVRVRNEEQDEGAWDLPENRRGQVDPYRVCRASGVGTDQEREGEKKAVMLCVLRVEETYC